MSFSINDQVKQFQTDNPVAAQNNLLDESQDGFNTSQEELKTIQEYNASVRQLNPLYSELKPISGVLVRMFCLEPEVLSNGLLVPRKQMVPIATQSGQGNLYEIESPFPYSQVAMVIATPSISSFQVGDIVQLGDAMVKASPDPNKKGKEGSIIVPHGYWHPSTNSFVIPTDMKSEHYGYQLIPPHAITMKLNTNA